MTPHWFHVWAYRHLLRMPMAGNLAAPFPTFLRRDATPRKLALTALDEVWNVSTPRPTGPRCDYRGLFVVSGQVLGLSVEY